MNEVLVKAEALCSFIRETMHRGQVSLLEKDIVLQNLRDIYQVASSMPLDDEFEDDFDMDMEDDRGVVLFDLHQDAPKVEEESSHEEVEPEIVPEPESEPELELELEPKPEVSQDSEEDSEEESEEDSEPGLGSYISPQLKLDITAQMCGGDEELCEKLISDIDKMDAPDIAIFYIQDNFPHAQNCSATATLAEIIYEKFN